MKIKLTAGDGPYTAELDPGVQQVEIFEAFNGVLLHTADGETLGVCMRDSGFEVVYMAGTVKCADITLNAGEITVRET